MSDDHGWKPGWDPVGDAERERAKKEAREQLGDVDEPDDKPFDALDYLGSLDQNDQKGGADDGEEHQKRASRRATIPVHRPPRALPEEEFLEACTRCEACIEACPYDAIELAGSMFRDAEGTPVINAAKSPCMMCEDTPCVTACEPNALKYALGLSMGDAAIQVHDCIAHTGGFCSTCVERCPVPGAIKVRDGKPTIRQAACTGCGVCHHVCPAPVNAVRLFPRKA